MIRKYKFYFVIFFLFVLISSIYIILKHDYTFMLIFFLIIVLLITFLKLIERNYQYKLIYNKIPTAILIFDLQGNILDVNRTACELYGYTYEEFKKLKGKDIVHPDYYFLFKKFIKDVNETGTFEAESVDIKKDGTRFNVKVKGAKFIYKENDSLIAIVRDITERKQREKELQKLKMALEQAPISVVITDKNGTIEYVNPFFCNLTGYSFEEAIGENPRILKSGKHDQNFYKILWDKITSGEIWEGEFLNKKKNGELYWEKAIIGPIFDERGNIINFFGLKEDITEIKRVKEQFYQIQKLESLGTLAAGIAHDFNNILYAIMGYIDLSLKKIYENKRINKETISQIVQYLQNIRKASDRAKELVSRILTFSRQTKQIRKKYINVKEKLKESINLIKDVMPKNIEVKVDLKIPDNLFIYASETDLSQIIVNLSSNARDAMIENGGILSIIAEKVDIDSQQIFEKKKSGEYLKLTISDTGKGMDKETLGKIFDPFFTTKEKSSGTGLGLAIVYGIIKTLKGYIKVDSEIGKGTTFNIYLPAYNKKLQEENEVKQKEISIKGKEKILFVDDEDFIVDAITEGLKDLGYKVLGITDPVEALKIFKKSPEEFDLVITDQTMPKMLGDKLGSEILKIRKDIPVILCTGYSDKINKEKALSIGFKEFIIKPLTITHLAEVIRKTLDKDY